MEDVYTTEGKITATTEFTITKTTSPKCLLSALQAELANLDGSYTSYMPLILTVTQLLRREPSFSGMSTFGKCTKRSLFPFLRDTLSWLTEQPQPKM